MTAIGDALRLAMTEYATRAPGTAAVALTPEEAARVAEATILATPGRNRPWLLVLTERVLEVEGREAIEELMRRCAERGCFAALTARDGEIRLLDDYNMAASGVVRTDLVRELLHESGGPAGAMFDQVMRNLGDTPGAEPPPAE